MTERRGGLVPLPPGSMIGIIGGGQLGRMLAESAARLGYRTTVLEPQDNCPAAQLTTCQIVAAYDEEGALAELAGTCAVVTCEFENVPVASAQFLEAHSTFYPGSNPLAISQDRLVEKTWFQERGIAVAPFMAVDGINDLKAGLARFPDGILKTRRLGYDGKGQVAFGSTDGPSANAALEQIGHVRAILESRIAFDAEISVIGMRALSGEIAFYEPARNDHENGILRRSHVPSGCNQAVVDKAQAITARALEEMGYIGVMGLEFFVVGEDLVVNEFAPRVHNTGHWTREACLTSQFDQHIRAITGHALGAAHLQSACVMENLLGKEADDIAPLLAQTDCAVTLYGKTEGRAGRKMGHVTRLLRPC